MSNFNHFPSRIMRVAAAQLGTVPPASKSREIVQRLVNLLEEAIRQDVQLVVFPETPFTTYFPRFTSFKENPERYFDQKVEFPDNQAVRPLFDLAKTSNVDICIGYLERTPGGEYYSTCIYFSGNRGKILSMYRKLCLEESEGPNKELPVDELANVGDNLEEFGFNAFRVPDLLDGTLRKGSRGPPDWLAGNGDPIIGMMLSSDRYWAEAWRTFGLQGTELILVNYNTPVDPAYILQYRPPTPAEEETPQESEARAYRQHKLAVEANSYMNGCFSISVARAGQAPGAATSLIGGSAIVHPDGRTLAQARGVGDELIVARIDLGDCKPVKKTMFNFTKRRKIAITGIIEQQKAGVNEPEFL